MKLFALIAFFAVSSANAQALYSGPLSAAKDKHLLGPIQLRVQNGIAEIYFGDQQEAKFAGTFSAKDSHSFQAEFKIARGDQIETVHVNGLVFGQKIKARIEVVGYPESSAVADLEADSNYAVSSTPRHRLSAFDEYDARMAAEHFLDLLAPRH